jgi:restriction endonuclease S subunit
VSPEYLHALLRLQTLRDHARLFFTGSAGHQRVSAEFFYRLKIPLPLLKIQERIVSRIAAKQAEAKRLRATAATQLAAAKQEIEGIILGTKEE